MGLVGMVRVRVSMPVKVLAKTEVCACVTVGDGSMVADICVHTHTQACWVNVLCLSET